MTYELFEAAKAIYEEIECCDRALALFTPNSPFDDDYHSVILQRLDDPFDKVHFGTDKIHISDELAYTLYSAVRTKKEELESTFAELGENP